MFRLHRQLLRSGNDVTLFSSSFSSRPRGSAKFREATSYDPNFSTLHHWYSKLILFNQRNCVLQMARDNRRCFSIGRLERQSDCVWDCYFFTDFWSTEGGSQIAYWVWVLWLCCVINSLQPSGHYMYRQFNIQQFYVLPTQCIYVFCVELRPNSHYFPIQH